MKNLSKESILGLFLVGLFVFMSLFAPGFLASSNLKNMMFQLPEFSILALAMMVVILTAGIDLSLTFVASLSGVVIAIALSSGYSIPMALLAGLLVALACGLLNGVFVAKIGVSPILVTLGTMILFEGINLSITKGHSISGFPSAYNLIGNGYFFGLVPVSLVIMIVLIIVTTVLLNKTKWGRSVYMVGSNPIATLFSGINTSRALMWVYLFSSLMAFVASVIMTARYNSAKVDMGSAYLLQCVAAAVLGGTQIQGGYGKVIGTVYAVCIFQILSSGLNLLGVHRSIVDVMIGVILIAVLIINYVSSQLEKRKSIKEQAKSVA